MPIDYSGEEGWNTAIKSLGGALFPDPSKAAHSYYYGAEARKAQLESNKLIGQQNIMSRLLQTTQPGVAPPAPITFQQPPLTGSAPIPAPPGNLPMSGVVMPSPAQAVQALPAAVAPLTAGTPPPYAPPSAVSPPSPTATGSNGSIVPDTVSGTVHPGSITPPDGGPKTTGPAASNGSPAPLPPNLNIQGLGTMAAAAGLDASMAGLLGQQAAAEAFRTGRIDAHTYHELLAGTGQAAPVGADIAGAAAIRGHELALKGTLGAAQIGAGATIRGHEITQAGENRRFDLTPQVIIKDGVPTYSTRAQAPGKPAFDSPLATEQERVAGAPVQTQPGGPGTPPVSMRQDKAQATAAPIYQPEIDKGRKTYQEWIDPKNPTEIIRATSEEGTARGLRAVPKTKDEWDAVFNSAVINAPDPATAQALRDKQAALGAGVPPKTPTENFENQFLIDTRLANAMPVPPGVGFGLVNKNPAGSSPNLQTTLLDLSNQYYRMDPQTRGDRAASTDKAIQQLADEGYIDLKQDRATLIGGHTNINKTGYDKNGNPIQQEHFRVDLLDPVTKQPYAEGKIPQITMRRSVSSAIVPPSSGAGAGAQAQIGGPAPAGWPEGKTGTLHTANGNIRAVNRGGVLQPAP
jgi:hypothetical protein